MTGKGLGHDLDARGAALDDYVRGAMDDARASDYEEDLFERALAGEAPEVTFRASLGAALRAMKARGTLDLWLTAAEVERLQGAGNLHVVLYNFNLERPVPPEIPAGADLVIARVPVDLRGVSRLDAEIVAADGSILKLMPDVVFEPDDLAVYACCEAELARVASATRTTTRLWAVSGSGRRLVVELPSF